MLEFSKKKDILDISAFLKLIFQLFPNLLIVFTLENIPFIHWQHLINFVFP